MGLRIIGPLGPDRGSALPLDGRLVMEGRIDEEGRNEWRVWKEMSSEDVTMSERNQVMNWQ